MRTGRRGERFFGIAALVRRRLPEDLFGNVTRRRVEVRFGTLGLVAHAEQLRGIRRFFKAPGDHDRDGLAIELDAVVLKQKEQRIVIGSLGRIYSRGVMMRHDFNHARRRARLGVVDGDDVPVGDGTGNDGGVHQSFDGDVARISRHAGDLLGSFDAVARGADEWLTHAAAISSARTSVRLASAIL